MSKKLKKVLELVEEMKLDIEYQSGPVRDVPVLFLTMEEYEDFISRAALVLDRTNATDRVYLFRTYLHGPCDVITLLLLTMDDLHAIDLYAYDPLAEVYHLAEGPITKQCLVDIMSPEWQADWRAFQQWKSQVQDPQMPADEP